MGSLILPPTGRVYVDTQILIYSVEKNPKYFPLLRPVWQAVRARSLELVTSELSVLETSIQPLRTKNAALLAAYDDLFANPMIHLAPITLEILRDASVLRAKQIRLRTPDAIHLATAARVGCVNFLTNDAALRGIGTIAAIVLADAAGP